MVPGMSNGDGAWRLVPSVIPHTLNVKFPPSDAPPRYGLIITNEGVDYGAGFINVFFTNCEFDPFEPTIFDNCWLSNVEFTNCNFRGASFQNVAISGVSLENCTFECSWYNVEGAEQFSAKNGNFKDQVLHTTVPPAIVAQKRKQQEARDAKRSKGTNEIEYAQYEPAKKPEISHEASSIPASVLKGFVFDHSPQAGLIVKAGKGSWYDKVQFIRCEFKSTTFDNCYIDGVVFQDCKFANATFKEVVFKDREYTNVGFDGCRWERRVAEKGVITDTVYRQAGLNSKQLPLRIKDRAIAQDKMAKRQELERFQRDRLGPVVVQAKGVVRNPNEEVLATTFVTDIKFD